MTIRKTIGKLHLIRHGMTEANEKRLYCGATDLSLSPNGIAQLEDLKREIAYPVAETYITSNMKRAKETLNILFNKSSDVTLDALNEYDFGDFEMKSHEELMQFASYQRWMENLEKNENFSCLNGESSQDFKQRVLGGLETVLALNAENVIVVCHGGVISVMMEHLFPDQHQNRYDWLPRHGRGYTVEIKDKQKMFREI